MASSKTSAPTLVTLPDKTLWRILGHLSIRDLGRVSCVSQRLSHAVTEALWKTAYERLNGRVVPIATAAPQGATEPPHWRYACILHCQGASAAEYLRGFGLRVIEEEEFFDGSIPTSVAELPLMEFESRRRGGEQRHRHRHQREREREPYSGSASGSSSAPREKKRRQKKRTESDYTSESDENHGKRRRARGKYISPSSLVGLGLTSEDVRYKTVLCLKWMQHGRCSYGEKCAFAHGQEELRPPPPAVPRAYKTKLCAEFSLNGWCHFGDRCHFIHPNDQRVTTDKSHLKILQDSRFVKKLKARSALPPPGRVNRRGRRSMQATPRPEDAGAPPPGGEYVPGPAYGAGMPQYAMHGGMANGMGGHAYPPVPYAGGMVEAPEGVAAAPGMYGGSMHPDQYRMPAPYGYDNQAMHQQMMPPDMSMYQQAAPTQPGAWRGMPPQVGGYGMHMRPDFYPPPAAVDPKLQMQHMPPPQSPQQPYYHQPEQHPAHMAAPPMMRAGHDHVPYAQPMLHDASRFRPMPSPENNQYYAS